jgi:hypothetical protein
MYGPQGSGKTYTALLFAEGLAKKRKGRIALVDTERGSDFYAAPRPSGAHPGAFDFDAIYTSSLSGVLDAVKKLDPKQHTVVVIDSISAIWDAAIEAYEGKLTGAETIPMQAWGKIKAPYKALIRSLMSAPVDVIICGRQKNEFTSEGGELRKIGVTMKAEGETPYEPHICVRMECRRSVKDSARSDYLLYAEKDRSSVLAGRTIANPDYSTIEPILSLMGDEQAPVEDDQDRMEADSELLMEQERKRSDRREESAAMLSQFSAALLGAQNLEELNVVAANIKKAKRKLMPDHVASLQEIYKERRYTLVNNLSNEAL